MTIPKNQVCLWYDGAAEEAFKFYASIFPDTSVGKVHRAPGDYPDGQEGDALVVEGTIVGIPVIGLNGGDQFKHSEAFSFQIMTEDQAETDRYWDAIVGNAGQESQCGWCKDKWGINWQITPRQLSEANFNSNPQVAKATFQAMMSMKKIDIAKIEAAARDAA